MVTGCSGCWCDVSPGVGTHERSLVDAGGFMGGTDGLALV